MPGIEIRIAIEEGGIRLGDQGIILNDLYVGFMREQRQVTIFSEYYLVIKVGGFSKEKRESAGCCPAKKLGNPAPASDGGRRMFMNIADVFFVSHKGAWQ